MKNYYQQLADLKIAEIRLQTLNEKQQLLLTKITKCTSSLNGEVVATSMMNDKMVRYVAESEELAEEIKYQEEIVKIYRDGVEKMDSIYRKLDGTRERVFTLYFKDRKSPVAISMAIPCSLRTVYYHLNGIRKELQ